MNAKTTVHRLKLVNPFGISRGTTREVEVFYLELEGGGTGECSPVKYKGHTLEAGLPLALKMAEGVDASNLFDLDYHAKRAREIAPHHASARAAFDIALHDRIGLELGIPIYKLAGYSSGDGAGSSFTIGLDTDEEMVRKTHEAASFPHLKIKLGRDDAARDMATLKKIRDAAPNKVIRVDANAGWSLDTARKCVKGCADLGIEFVEAPLAIGNLDQLGILKKESPLPLIADEDVQDLSSLTALLGKVDGINIKLMKCGGLWEARQMIGFARGAGWTVMLGCMIETSVAIGAAAHLGGAAICLDLDAELLIANNPCGPGTFLQTNGKMHVSDRPGLGVQFNSLA